MAAHRPSLTSRRPVVTRASVRATHNPAEINASIGFSAQSATVADAARRRLERRRITKDERLALDDMALVLEDLATYLSHGQSNRLASGSRRYAFRNLGTLAASLPAQGTSEVDTKKTAAWLRRMVRDIRVVSEWRDPDTRAAKRVSSVFGNIADDLLATVSMPSETGRILT